MAGRCEHTPFNLDDNEKKWNFKKDIYFSNRRSMLNIYTNHPILN